MKGFKILLSTIMMSMVMACQVDTLQIKPEITVDVTEDKKESTDDIVSVPTKKSGQLSMVAVKESGFSRSSSRSCGLERVNSISRADATGDIIDTTSDEINFLDDSDYAFGAIKGSKRFYFMLKNSGDYDIINIVLSTSNPAFQIFPKTIAKIEPFATATSVPIITVDVLHGTVLEGVGFASLLPKGLNVSEILINGDTKDAEGLPAVTTVDIDMSVFGLVADVEFLADDNTCDLTKATEFNSEIVNMIHPITGNSVKYINIYSPNAKLRNTGNTPVTYTVMTFYKDTAEYITVLNKTLNIGEEDVITLIPSGANAFHCVILVNTVNVVYNVEKFGSIMNGILGINPVYLIPEM